MKCPICDFENPSGQPKCRRCGTPMPRNSDPGSEPQKRATAGKLRQGQVLANRYYVLAEIGRGGMGSIYRVKDNTLKEEVALKTLLPQFLEDKHVVERFFNEARIARTLSHPNIVRVHDIGASQGTVYISMELLSGKSLRQVLEGLMPGDRLPIRQVLDVFDQLCAALEYAHRYTVHRDLKPENVMVMEDGTVKLMDFGISKLMGDANLTSASMVMGTPHYMPPEQVKHSAGVDARADLYSLGVMLYETLSGSLPTAIHKPVSKIIRGIPPSLDPIIETCLQDDPNRRYASAGELRAALTEVREQLGFTAGAASYRPRHTSRGIALGNPRRAVGAMLLAVLAAGTGLGLWRAEASRKHTVDAWIAATSNTETPTQTEMVTFEAEPTPLSLQSIAPILQSARVRAESAVRGLAEGEQRSYRERLMDEGREWEQTMADASGTDERVAFEAGMQALHRYVALVIWPENGVFVPPAGSEGGFFIQDRPVTAGEFDAFSTSGDGWRWPLRAGKLRDDESMVYLTWYDAQACLASQPALNVFPTEQQWARAVEYAKAGGVLRVLGQEETATEPAEVEAAETGAGVEPEPAPDWSPEFWIENGLFEWTSTVSGAERRSPGFGDSVAICGATANQRTAKVDRGNSRFERGAGNVGFRGALPLPMSVEGVKAAL